MNEEFARQVLRKVVGRVCQPLGVHGMQSTVCETMTDVLKSYLLTLAKTTSSYCLHANRTEPNLSDLAQAFGNLGVDLADLSEFLKEVESSPLNPNIPRFPVPRKSSHVYSGPASFGEASKRRLRAPSLSSEDEEYDHIPPYLPPLPSQHEEDKDDDSCSASMEIGEASNDINSKDDIATPTPLDPHKGLPQLFRPRGFSSDYSEDGDSRRNSMSEGGVVMTPLRSSTPEMLPLKEESLSEIAVVERTPQDTAKKVSTPEAKDPDDKEVKRNIYIGEDPSPLMAAAAVTSKPSDNVPPKLPSSVQEATKKDATVVTISEVSHSQSEGITARSKQFQPVLPPPPKLPKVSRGSQLPPPLRLISPSSEPVSQSHPNLSPISRSPGGRFFRVGMPVLSPLHTPIRPALPPPLTQRRDSTHAETTPLSPIDAHPLIPSLVSDSLKSSMPIHPSSAAPPIPPPLVSPSSSHFPAADKPHPSSPPSDQTGPHPLRQRTEIESKNSQQDLTPTHSQITDSIPEYKVPGSRHIPQKVPLKTFSVEVERSLPSMAKSPTPTPEVCSDVEDKELEKQVSVNVPTKLLATEKDSSTDSVDHVELKDEVAREEFQEFSSSSGSSPSPSPTPSPQTQEEGRFESPALEEQVDGSEKLDVSEERDRTEDREVDLDLHHSPISSGNLSDDKEVFSFDQEMIPEQMSLSHSPSLRPPMLIPSSPPAAEDRPLVGIPVVEEVATLDSGVGGAGFDDVIDKESPISATNDDIIISDIIRGSSYGDDDGDDIVQTVVGRESPPSDDDIIQSSAKDHAHKETTPPQISQDVLDVLDQDFSSDDSDDSDADSDDFNVEKEEFPPVSGIKVHKVAKRPTRIENSGRSDDSRESTGVGANLSPEHKPCAEKVEHQSQIISKSSYEEVLGIKKSSNRSSSGRAPPHGNKPLPLSPLVVHFKRHMIPSLQDQQQQENSASHFKTKAEMKAELIMPMPYCATPTPQTPSSSPTPSLSPAPPSPPPPHHHPVTLPNIKLTPLTISIKRRYLRNSRHGLTTPTDNSTANRMKKIFARFDGGGGAAISPTTVAMGQTGASSVHPPVPLVSNPRKRELDMSEVGFSDPGNQAKRARRVSQADSSPGNADEASTSSSSSSSDEEEDSGSESPSATPSPSPTPTSLHHPHHHHFLPRPRTPSSIDNEEEEEEVMTPESCRSSVGPTGSLKLTIRKELLPSATVQQLGGRGSTDQGSYLRTKKTQKSSKPMKIPPADLPGLTINRTEPIKMQQHMVSSKVGKVGGRKTKGTRGRGIKSSFGATQKRSLSSHSPVVSMSAGMTLVPAAVPVMTQGSDTICPECGLKDDGSPMIGCDHCDSWVHWVCGGITAAPPEDQKWYCPDCQKSGVGVTSGGKKKGRKKRKQQ